ncbi:MAG: SRPBCC family protein [Pseudomonadota bacterium]
MIHTRYKIAIAAIIATSLHTSGLAQEPPQLPPRIDGAVQVDQHTAAPLQFSRSAEVSATPDQVWAYLSENGNVASLFENVRSISYADVGETRRVKLNSGGTVNETVVTNDSQSHTYSYAISDKNPIGISDHLAVLTVSPADERDGSVVTWNHYFDAEDGNAGSSMSDSLDSALATLTAKLGGYASHGGNEGFSPVLVRQSRIVNASKGEVWKVVAEGFADAHVWSSSIAKITITDNNGDQVVGDQRACFIPAFNGETKETVTQYDEDAGIFAYSVDQGLPPFVTYGEAVWSLSAIDRSTTKVTVEIKAETAVGVPQQAIAFFRGGMAQLVGVSVDEAKYFIERGRAHPRKIAAVNQANSSDGD